MSQSAGREIRAGLVVLLGLGGLVALVSLAGSGPGFLSSRQTIAVVFRDGQGVRVGCPVRIAGIDAGRVAAVDLTEVDGSVRARLKLSVPASLVARLRQDARIAIESGLTGQVVVNIVDAGRSSVSLVPGQEIAGVETSLFDPLLEQVGLGPTERDGLRATIAEVRATAEVVGPRMRELVTSLQETTAGLREMLDSAKPALTTLAGRVETIAEGLDPEKVQASVERLDTITREVETLLVENRPALTETISTVKGMVTVGAPKVEALLDGLNATRVRADGVLASTGIVTSQAAELMTSHRANLDRTLSNVREASDYGARLVQKLYGNPFYLSPFYKPTKEDIRAQEVYDAANTFLIGAKELRDAITSLQAMRTKPPAQMTQREKEAYEKLYQRAWTLQSQLEGVSQGLAEGLRGTTRR